MTTKFTKKITADHLTGNFLVDGKIVDQIEVAVGNEVILDIDITSSPVIDVDRTVWVTLDNFDTDFRRRLDAGNAFRLPRVSTLLGEPLPSEVGGIPNKGGRLLMDMSSARISDILHAKIWTYKGETDGDLPNVKISSGDGSYSCPEDFRTEIGSDGGVVVRLENNALRANGSFYRVKHRLPTWATGQGVRAGKIVMRPYANSKFKTAWLTSDDYSIKPIKIVVVSEPSIQLATNVDSRIPEGMKEEATGFAVMLKDFFNFACRSDGPLTALMNLDTLRDIDTAKIATIERMINERAPFIALNSVADRRIILKHAVRFFENRGNPRSWAYLSRVIFGRECEVDYPSERVFRTSDADWRQFTVIKGISISQVARAGSEHSNRVLKTLSMNAEDAARCTPDLLKNLIGVQIKGLTSSASAIVEDVIQTTINSEIVSEFKLSNVRGDFVSNEIVAVKEGLTVSDFDVSLQSIRNFSFYTGTLITGVTAPIGLRPGSHIAFTNCGDAAGMISDVNGDVDIVSCGWVTGTPTAVADGVTLKVETGAMFNERGEWIGGQSFASDDWIHAQDCYYYQLFSYVVSSDVSEEEFYPHSKEYLHPVGFKAFYRRNAKVSVTSTNLESNSFSTVLEPSRRTIYAGENLANGRCYVYANGKPLVDSEIVLGRLYNAFVRIDKSNEIRTVSINVTSDTRDSSLVPTHGVLEDMIVNGAIKSESTQNPDYGVTMWQNMLLSSSVHGQLGESNPDVWWVYFTMPRNEDSLRTAKRGVTLVRNGIQGVVVAAWKDDNYVGGVLAFNNKQFADNFQIDSQTKRIVL